MSSPGPPLGGLQLTTRDLGIAAARIASPLRLGSGSSVLLLSFVCVSYAVLQFPTRNLFQAIGELLAGARRGEPHRCGGTAHLFGGWGSGLGGGGTGGWARHRCFSHARGGSWKGGETVEGTTHGCESWGWSARGAGANTVCYQ
jgi:hypothetical protein